jgi:hypothetical protein
MEPIQIIKPLRSDNSIDRLPPPVIDSLKPPVVNGLQVPVVDLPSARLEYPRVDLPYQESNPNPAPSKPQEPEEQPREKTRELKDSPPPPSQQPQIVQPPATPIAPQINTPAITVPKEEQPRVSEEKPAEAKTMEVAVLGHEINVPTPTAVVEAGATAVIGTSATLITALVFNQVRQAAAPVLQKLARDKFKIKLKKIKPVIHFVKEGELIHVIQYDGEDVKLLNDHVDNPEQYLRDLIDTDPLYEADHTIIIDEPVKDFFTKEGTKRFNYFISSKKLVKKLSARFSL